MPWTWAFFSNERMVNVSVCYYLKLEGYCNFVVTTPKICWFTHLLLTKTDGECKKNCMNCTVNFITYLLELFVYVFVVLWVYIGTVLFGPQCISATLLVNHVLSPFLQVQFNSKHRVMLNSLMLLPILPDPGYENDDNSVRSTGVTVIWKGRLKIVWF